MVTSGKRSKTRLDTICIGAVLILSAILLIPAVAVSSPKKLVDDSEYKEKDFRKCNIKDYSDMEDGGDVHWVWIDPSVKLSQYKLKEGKVENKSEIHSRSMVDMVKNLLKDTFADLDVKGEKGALTADVCIFWAENFSGGKAWIPFVGGHQMQAGIGMEWLLRDGKNRVVAKFRHDAREGVQIEAAAQEVVGDLMKYIGDH